MPNAIGMPVAADASAIPRAASPAPDPPPAVVPACQPATATRDGLDQHRKADPLGFFDQMPELLVFAMIAGDDWHARLLHQRPCRRLGSYGPDRRC